MKYSTAYVVALATMSSASPLPQFSFPSFGGSFSRPSFPSFGGGSFSLPTSFPSFPGTGGGLTPTGGAEVTPTPTGGVSQPPATQAPSNGSSVGSNCTPQASRGGSSENGVKDKNCCTDVTVIFARGTGETGNVGTISGPPMFKSLRNKLGADKVTIQGVDYPANSAGNANLGASGGPAMASSVKAANSQCPSTKVIVSGYSQGGMVVHNAFSAQGLSSSQVAGAVLFGDPLIRQKVGDLSADKVKQFCGTSDGICGQPAGGVNGGHLSYGSVADAAADFVIQAAGLSA